MTYIAFDKTKLINLEYALNREMIRSNRAGAYASTTIINCNTRKYHGLLVAPQPALDGENHVLLSALDPTVIQNNSEFNLGIHRYQGGYYNPKGHKYVDDFTTDPIPKITYRVGGVVLTREALFAHAEDQVLIRFTLVDAHSPTKLRFKPFMAFRNVHRLSKANVDVQTKYDKILNGIKVRMYTGYSFLNMQFSKPVDYIHVPDWYYNIEYNEEKERGYDCLEDLFVPGYFEVDVRKGESIIFSAATEEINPETLIESFDTIINNRIPRNGFRNCLINAAQQFIVRKGFKTEVIAGFPWFGRWGRDTFIALPGLTLAINDVKTCKDVIDTMLTELNGPLFPNVGSGVTTALNSIDAPLWFFWSLQQYAEHTNTKHLIWNEYGDKMKMILYGFKKGTHYNIKMLDDGLIYGGEFGKALTWMDAVVHGRPITPRMGKCVEINALWYNAMMFSLEVAKLANDINFVNDWEEIANKFPANYKETFWSKDKGYLADYVYGDYKDWSVRPNQVIVTSLPYSPISEQIRKLIIDISAKELLTPRGLRTLTPKHPDYKGIYHGDQETRDSAYHQGTVWPWLLGHFVEGYLKIHGKSGLSYVKGIYNNFEPVMREHGIGTISEVYDGDPPHKAGGAVSQAWSVAELLRIEKLIEKYDNL